MLKYLLLLSGILITLVHIIRPAYFTSVILEDIEVGNNVCVYVFPSFELFNLTLVLVSCWNIELY